MSHLDNKKRSGNRLKYQVTQCINSINKIGESKRIARQRGGSLIHSVKQIKEALSVCQNFAEWLQQENVTDLFQLKKSHYRAYIDYMKAKERSNGHLINIETNLRLLDKGMRTLSKSKGCTPRFWIPRTRLVKSVEREKPVNRAVAAEQLKIVSEKLSANGLIAFQLQLAFGLRLKEVAQTKRAFILEEEGTIYWHTVAASDALNKAKGVTKGGRPRKTPCLPMYEATIRKLIQDKQPDEFLVPIRYNSIKSAYYRAGLEEGSHGLRHTYARIMLHILLQRLPVDLFQSRRMLTQIIENHEVGYRKDHLVSKENLQLYRQVNEIMDIVHDYLGHGENRTDLARVYLSE